MIKDILNMLQLDEWVGISENIDIAKGKYRKPKTMKDAIKSYKRWRRKQ
jgi:hypothetical protein